MHRDLPYLPRARVTQLKARTAIAHQRLDVALAAAHPFGNLVRYREYLKLQHALQGGLRAIYTDRHLNVWIPGLAALSRDDLIRADMRALAMSPGDPVPMRPGGHAEALGWLYATEAAHMDMCFLFRQADGLLLRADAGALHLAPCRRGAPTWRELLRCLDGIELGGELEERLIRGALAAFAHHREQLGRLLRDTVDC